MRRLPTAFLLLLLSPAVAALAKDPPGANKDPTDAATRYRKHTVGDKPEEWASHLGDSDPARRLEAVKLLGDSNDPKAIRYLMDAVESPDPRISAAAVDMLGRAAAPEAADLLSEKLLRPGSSPMFRQRLLVALGKIADPATGPRVMDFLAATSDPALRATAVHALGEIGDASTRGKLQEMSARETDPAMKGLLTDAMARIAERQIHPGPARPGERREGETAIFTHGEPGGGPPPRTDPTSP